MTAIGIAKMTPFYNMDKKPEQFLNYTIKLNIFTITKTDENDNAEQIDFTKKFWDYLLNDGLEWILENRNKIREQCNNNDTATSELGIMLIIVAKYLGLSNEEKSRRINELLPIANAVRRCAESNYFKISQFIS